nr:MAG TPA: hypothetical protein [Caudoviricetes sp.]
MRVIHIDLRFVVLVQVGGGFSGAEPGGVDGGQQHGQDGAADDRKQNIHQSRHLSPRLQKSLGVLRPYNGHWTVAQ